MSSKEEAPQAESELLESAAYDTVPPNSSSVWEAPPASSSGWEEKPPRPLNTRVATDEWQSRFVNALDNRDGSRTSGFFALSTSSGLVAIRDTCLQQMTGSQVLLARYRIAGPPGPGTLMAALASDILSVQSKSTQVHGELQSTRPDGWQSYVSALAPKGELPWVQAIAHGAEVRFEDMRDAFDGLAAPLAGDDRLVLLVRVDSRTASDDASWASFSQLVLPYRVSVVFGFTDLGPLTDVDARTGQGPGLGPLRLVSLTLDGVPLDEESAETAYRQDRVANLTEDRPAHKDVLGRGTLAGTLANLLMHAETQPLCIGIEAPWGKGKSTFLNLVEDGVNTLAAPGFGSDADPRTRARAAANRVVVTRFEAWQYDNAQEAWAGLARQVIGGIEASLTNWQRLQLRWAYAWKYRRRRLLGGAGGGLAALALATVLVSTGGSAVLNAADVKSPVAKAIAVVFSPTLLSFIALLAGLFKLTKPVSARVTEYLARPDYGERLGFQHQVIRDLKFCKTWFTEKRPDARIVVMVDDLDRCSDEKIVEILQAINVVLADSGLYVLLGLDGDVVRRAIYRHYADNEDHMPAEHQLPEDFAADYLRKIVQFSIHLPDSSVEERTRYLDALLQQPEQPQAATAQTATGEEPFSVNLAQLMPPQVVREVRVRDTLDDIKAMKAYQQVLADNPRELKRLVNMHRFIKIALLSIDPNATASPRVQRLLVQWLVFCTAQPHLVERALEVADEPQARADVLGGVTDDEGHLEWLAALRAQLPEDVIAPADLAYGSPLRRAAGLAVNLP